MKKLTEYYDTETKKLKKQSKIKFNMKIICPKLDKVAKYKNYENYTQGADCTGDFDDDDEGKNEKDKEKILNLKAKTVLEDSVNVINFRMKMSMEMGKLKNSYAKRVGVPVTDLRFLLNGRPISDDETPKDLELEKDDVIEVFSWCHTIHRGWIGEISVDEENGENDDRPPKKRKII